MDAAPPPPAPDQAGLSAGLAGVLRELAGAHSAEELTRALETALQARWPAARVVAGPQAAPPDMTAHRIGAGAGERTLLWPGEPRLPAEQAQLELFCAGVGALQEGLGTLERTERLHRLAEGFAGQGEFPQQMLETMGAVMDEFSLLGLAGLVDRHGTLRPTPQLRVGEALPLPEWSARDMRALRRGELSRHPGGVLVPLSGRWRARSALWLATRPGHVWAAHDLRLIEAVAHAAGLELERVQVQQHISTLLALQSSLLNLDPDAAYQPLLEQALRVIPGAERGSLLVRDGPLFRYRAAITHDMAELEHVTFRLEDVRDHWYGAGQAAWEQGVARLIQRPLSRLNGVGFLRDGQWVHSPLPSVQDIQANVGVPVLYRGEVYAFLNVDACRDPHAFDQDSMEVARSFALQAAVLLHETRQRARIELAARTDALTGLPNRRAFTEALDRQLEQARRLGTPLTLLVMDAHRFKAINDRLGHSLGDLALSRLGAVLSGTLRAGDEIFRWGGDEFAALLPNTSADGARQVVARLHGALRGETLGGLALRVTIGQATAQDAAELDGRALLRAADLAMYRAKRRGRRSVKDATGPKMKTQ